MNRVDGKVALVTGGARGIGGETARQLVAAGAKVVMTDLLQAEGEALAAELNEAGANALFLTHDVTSESDWERAVAETTRQFGPLDILVNNAGVWSRGIIEETLVDEFDKLCAVNLKGVFLGTKYAIGAMKSRPADADSASIVNLSSTAGLVGSATSAVYSMTKGGVRLFTKSTAIEVRARGYNIRCNSVHPGATESPMQDDILATSNMSPDEIKAFKQTRNLLGRYGEPIDIAKAILFLASNDSAFMTGSEMVVDGGYTAR
ncbi:MAG: glucose 1-dehydrogenase [Alphaproteobacteria bacterium]|nr:glucose 1-dehydrogenase [Alphaproteobacteria bacterium]